MKSSTVSTILALIAAILAAAYTTDGFAIRAERSGHEPIFPALFKSSISRIEISTPTGKIALKNSTPVKKDIFHAAPVLTDNAWDDSWSVESSNLAISEVPLDTLLNALVGLSFDIKIPKRMISSDLSNVGLDTPAYEIKIESTGGNEEIALGKLHPAGDKLYVSVLGHDGVYLVGSTLLKTIEKIDGLKIKL